MPAETPTQQSANLHTKTKFVQKEKSKSREEIKFVDENSMSTNKSNYDLSKPQNPFPNNLKESEKSMNQPLDESMGSIRDDEKDSKINIVQTSERFTPSIIRTVGSDVEVKKYPHNHPKQKIFFKKMEPEKVKKI